MKYCAETDPQAKRLLYILQEFRAVVADSGNSASRDSSIGVPLISSTPSSTFDPMASLPGAYDPTGRAHSTFDNPLNDHKLPSISRHNSLAAMAVPNLTEPSSSLGPKIDTGLSMSGITPPHSNNSASMDYFRPIPAPTSTETAEGLGDTAIIDFDSFWQWGSLVGTGAPTDIPVPVPTAAGFATNPMAGAGAGGFPAFGMNAAGGAGGIGMNGNIPMYPPSNFV